ncbi:MAG: hypothetical protein ACOWWO_11575 [Peptococcaceae bacterium]
MSSSRKIVLIIALGLFLVFGYYYLEYRTLKVAGQDAEEFANRIMSAVKTENIIDLRDMTPFEWDKLYYFPAYTPPEQMYELTGARWTNCDTFLGYLFFNDLEKEMLQDGFYTLVFVADDKVVGHYPGKRDKFDFEMENEGDLKADAALFKISRQEGRGQGKYPLLIKQTAEGETLAVKDKVEQLLQEIIANGPAASSNPYDYLKDNAAFAELVALGDPARAYMFASFAQSHEDGLREYIMAAACAKIMGNFDEEKGLGINSGREWFYKYAAFKQDDDFPIVDADYELFKDTAGRAPFVLPAHTDLQDLEDVISNCILARNRKAYRMGEKAIEAHKVYRAEEKGGTINVYLLVSFRWFGFANNTFTAISGGGGEPVRIQLQKSAGGEYEVLEYKEALDGGMRTQSIKEIFPGDLAEIVITGDEETSQDLWEQQVVKAKNYLAEIDRADAPVIDRMVKDRTDKQAARAIDLVVMLRRIFPDWDGTREILVNAGGRHPGMKLRCILETKCISTGEGQYQITLTKTWEAKINGIQPVSCWQYRVTGERVELISEQDRDGLIQIIK